MLHRDQGIRALDILFAVLAFVLTLPSSAVATDAVRTHALTESPAGATDLVDSNAAPGVGRVAPPLMPGWPQTMGTTVPFSPVGVVLADVDNNGDLEVLAGSTDSRFRVWHHDGTLLPGWPLFVGGRVQAKAAAADLDHDGDLEIAVSTSSGQLQIYHHDATALAGWPQSTGVTFGFLAPTIYDLDDDGTPEIMIGGGSSSLVRAWHADGTPVAGFPQAVAGTISGTLAVGDLIGDSSPEIFAVTTSPGQLNAFNIDGTVPPGWPVTFGLSTSWAAPSIGDLDNNGSREIMVVAYNFGVNTSLYAYQGDGSVFPNFPVTYPSDQTFSCPVVGDIDGDDDLELFNAGKVLGNSFYAWDHQGNVLPGWPVPFDFNAEGSAVLANLDGDSDIEMVIGDNFIPGSLFGFNPDGTAVADFPFPKLGASLPNAPELADVDRDGDLDLAMTMSTGDVAIWDLPEVQDPEIEWGGLFHDNWNTNQHGFVVPGGTTGIAVVTAPSRRVVLVPASPNPFNPSTEIPFVLEVGGPVELRVHDAQGRLVRELVSGYAPAGENRVKWDGRGDDGSILPSGVYWLQLSAGGEVLRGGVTLLK